MKEVAAVAETMDTPIGVKDLYYPKTDLDVALMFLPELDGLTLLVDQLSWMPFLRREIKHSLGDPDRYGQDFMRYGSKIIKIIKNQPSAVYGLKEENVFVIQSLE